MLKGQNSIYVAMLWFLVSCVNSTENIPSIEKDNLKDEVEIVNHQFYEEIIGYWQIVDTIPVPSHKHGFFSESPEEVAPYIGKFMLIDTSTFKDDSTFCYSTEINKKRMTISDFLSSNTTGLYVSSNIGDKNDTIDVYFLCCWEDQMQKNCFIAHNLLVHKGTLYSALVNYWLKLEKSGAPPQE